MPSPQPVRRLAAIAFTDIVGYSKLVHRDDANALKLVAEHFALVREISAGFGGRVIKTIGDSVHLEFASAQSATSCAIAIQQRHAQRNAGVAEAQRFEIRIGVHLGDIEHRDGDTYGDGVNIAARLQPLAPVGGIAISDHVRGQLTQALRGKFVARGAQELKNIETPVEVFVIEAPAIAELRADSGSSRPAPASPFVRRPSTWMVIALAVIGIGLYIAKAWHHAPDAQRGVEAPAATGDKSIAVLPLANSTGDPANEYFSDGISEELISSLSRLSNLKVIGRTSSFQFRNTTDTSDVIGKKLGVSYLLEGSVRKSSDRVRIAVALVSSADGANVWSDSYDRELKDIFAVQSEIAAAVANQLQAALFGSNAQAAQASSAATPSNRNVEAYKALLQGNYYFYRRTPDDYHRAIGFYEEAIRLDPDYALAWARLSRTNVVMVTQGDTTPEEYRVAIDRARVAADTALRLNANLGDTHFARGMLAQNADLDWTVASTEFARAIELDPHDALLLTVVGFHGAVEGKFDQARAAYRESIALDPLFSTARTFFARALIGEGAYDEAEAMLRESIEVQPLGSQNYMELATIKLLRGDTAGAVEVAKKETDPFWRIYTLALAFFANGDRALADEKLQKLIRDYGHHGGAQIASVYAARKDPDKMFEWLEHARVTKDPGSFLIRIDPFLARYKDDPRYEAFGRKIGLPGPT